jgi:FkbM family methyltransferase
MTLVASSLVAPEQIYSFEPNPDTFRELQDNLELNAIQVNAFNLALSDKAERCRLFVPEGACGGSSIEAKNYQRRDLLPGEAPPKKFHEVDAVVFDDFRRERVKNPPAGGARYVVKLDAEGHEIPIIAGMKAFIRENIDRVTLVVELYESEYAEAVKAIGALGLKGRILLGDGTRGPVVAPEKNRFANYCFEAAGADGGGEA